MAREITFKIKKKIAVLSTAASGWSRELNLVSWNGAEPKYDIRDWNPEHDKMGKGVTLTEEELNAIITVFSEKPKTTKKAKAEKVEEKAESKPAKKSTRRKAAATA